MKFGRLFLKIIIFIIITEELSSVSKRIISLQVLIMIIVMFQKLGMKILV